MDAKTPSQYRRSLLPFYAIAILGACQQLDGRGRGEQYRR